MTHDLRNPWSVHLRCFFEAITRVAVLVYLVPSCRSGVHNIQTCRNVDKYILVYPSTSEKGWQCRHLQKGRYDVRTEETETDARGCFFSLVVRSKWER